MLSSNTLVLCTASAPPELAGRFLVFKNPDDFINNTALVTCKFQKVLSGMETHHRE